MSLFLLILFYLWLGFTVGYFFRKWLDVSYLKNYAAEKEAGQTRGPASKQEWIDWVDDNNHTLKTVSRAEMREKNLLHRVSSTIVFSPEGQIFAQQRTQSKDVYPGLFDLMVGGTVVSGETPEQNAVREVAEELGITGVPLYPLFQHHFKDEHTNSLIFLFACQYSGKITLQEEEVAWGDWISRETAQEWVEGGKLCPDSAQSWGMFLAQNKGPTTLAELVKKNGLIPVSL